jgi:hypothetical protein
MKHRARSPVSFCPDGYQPSVDGFVWAQTGQRFRPSGRSTDRCTRTKGADPSDRGLVLHRTRGWTWSIQALIWVAQIDEGRRAGRSRFSRPIHPVSIDPAQEKKCRNPSLLLLGSKFHSVRHRQASRGAPIPLLDQNSPKKRLPKSPGFGSRNRSRSEARLKFKFESSKNES